MDNLTITYFLILLFIPTLSEYGIGGVFAHFLRKLRLWFVRRGNTEQQMKALERVWKPIKGKKFLYWPSICMSLVSTFVFLGSKGAIRFDSLFGYLIGMGLMAVWGLVTDSTGLSSPAEFARNFRNRQIPKYLFKKGNEGYQKTLIRVVKQRLTPGWREIARQATLQPKPWMEPILQAALFQGDVGITQQAITALVKLDPALLTKELPHLLKSNREEVQATLLENANKLPVDAAEKVIASIGEKGNRDLREKAQLALEVKLSRPIVDKLTPFLKDPGFSGFHSQLHRLIGQLSKGRAASVHAARIALESLETPAQWQAYFQEWQEAGKTAPLVPVIQKLTHQPGTQALTALLRLAGIGDLEIQDPLVSALRQREDLKASTIERWALTRRGNKKEVGIQLASRLYGELKTTILVKAFAESDPELRRSAVKAVAASKWDPALMPFYKQGLNDKELQVKDTAAIEIRERKQYFMLPLLLNAYPNWVPKSADKLLGLDKEIKTTIQECVEMAPFFKGEPSHLFCPDCLTRTESKKVHKWQISACRKCGKYIQLKTGIPTVIGYIGQEAEKGKTPENNWSEPVWDLSSKTVPQVDIERLEIREGGAFDYDWAVAAVMELLEANKKRMGFPVEIVEVGNPPLAVNTRTLLADYAMK